MVRTQVRFTPTQKQRGEALAREQGVSFAEIVRRALDRYESSFDEDEALQELLADALLQSIRKARHAVDRANAKIDGALDQMGQMLLTAGTG